MALVAITLWLVFPHDIYYLCAGSTLPKFYGYSVLVVLNSRIEIVGSRGTHPATTSQIIAAVSLPQFTRDTCATIDREDPPIGAITREVSSNVESDNRGEMKVMGVCTILPSLFNRRALKSQSHTGFSDLMPPSELICQVRDAVFRS